MVRYRAERLVCSRRNLRNLHWKIVQRYCDAYRSGAGNEKEKLPKIDENVMIGDLMDCAKTADYVEERLMPYIGEFIGKTSMKEMDEMERSMVYYMPLSSLRSFTKLDNEGLGELVDELKIM